MEVLRIGLDKSLIKLSDGIYGCFYRILETDTNAIGWTVKPVKGL